MKQIYILCLVFIIMFVNSANVFADEILYPAGGLQINCTYDNGTKVDGFCIGNALKNVFPAEYKKLSVVDDTMIEGIQVNNSETESTDKSWRNEGPSAALIFEYDIMFTDLVETKSQAVIRILDSTKTYNTAFAEIYLKGDTKTIEVKTKWDGSFVTSDTFTEELKDNKWYHIRHTLNITDAANNFNPKHTININGIDAFVNLGPASVNYYKFPTVNSMVIEKNANADNRECTMYIDNVLVFKTNSNTPNGPVNRGKTLGIIRDAESVYKNSIPGTNPDEYPPEQYAALKSVIDDAKAEFLSNDFTDEKAEEIYNTLTEFLQGYKVNGEPLVIGVPYIKYYKEDGGETKSLLLAKEARFTVPVKTSHYAQDEKVTLLVVVSMGVDEDGDPIVKRIITSNTILYGNDVEEEAYVSLSLENFSFSEKANLRFWGMVWDEFETSNPYLIPKFDSINN